MVAATDAYARKDYQWIKGILKKLQFISYIMIAAGGVLILLQILYTNGGYHQLSNPKIINVSSIIVFLHPIIMG